MSMARKNEELSPEARARRRAEYLSGLMWHGGTFAIINVFFWLLDASGTGGINWSPVITVCWGLALAFHALAYWIDGRQVEERKTREFLAEDHRQSDRAPRNST